MMISSSPALCSRFHWKAVFKNGRLKKELSRLVWALGWFLLCALLMVIVQLYGDSTHVRRVRRLWLSPASAATAGAVFSGNSNTSAIMETWSPSSSEYLRSTGVYDVIFENLPNFLDHRILNPDLMLHTYLIFSLIAAALHWSLPVFIRRFRRYFWLYGWGYLLRMFTLAFTILPPSNVACVPVERTLLESLAMAPKLMFGGAHSCTDKIFSGHTTVATLLFWSWQEARTEAGDAPLSRWRFYAMTHLLSMALTSILGRNHYTVDIIVSFIVNSMSYWIYRLLLALGAMRRRSSISLPVLVPQEAVDLVQWCDGIDLHDCDALPQSVMESVELDVVI